MGLATSQVRLLALTSRKADVEMQIQLNSKRKTMLTREATELAKLYNAKLHNSKIQYATAGGYKDVTYNYLMGADSSNFLLDIISGGSSSERKPVNGMLLTDAYGRVVLSGTMLKVVMDTINDKGLPNGIGVKDSSGNYTPGKEESIESLSILAIEKLLEEYSSGSPSGVGSLLQVYSNLLDGQYQSSTTPADLAQARETGYQALQLLYRNGYNFGGVIYQNPANNEWYSSPDFKSDPITLVKGTFYVPKSSTSLPLDGTGNDGLMYLPGGFAGGAKGFLPTLNGTTAKQIVNLMEYYGNIFAASFKGQQTIGNPGSYELIKHLNIAVSANNIKNHGQTETSSGNYRNQYEILENDKFNNMMVGDNLQAGLKSGVYQLVNITNKITGEYAVAQNLDYFAAQNLVVEKADNSQREEITAWYNAARADLNEKETYWDSEVSSLSAELNTITTEIESVKKLREDAISSTFKWGGA